METADSPAQTHRMMLCLKVPPMTPEKTKEVIEQRLGKPIDEVFAWIDLEAPLGSASIAQVIHKLPVVILGPL